MRELSRIAKYLLGTGIKEESVGTVVKYEAEHGITIKALRRYADDLVEMGVSRDQVGHVIEETAKHGTPASGLVQGLGMFLESAENLKKEITLTVNVNGELKTIRVVMQRGNERSGLIHAYLRHVWGYEMDVIKSRAKTKITTFWPMGQKIMVNGEVKQLPKVFNSEEELAEFLDEVLERALQKEEYYTEFRGQSFVKLRVSLNELGMPIDGIDVVEFQFSYNQAKGAYEIITAYPSKGRKVLGYVWDRERQAGRWIYMG